MRPLLGIDHAQITIPLGQEAEARDFYCDFLGLEELEKPESLKARGGFWLAVGELQVHVGAEEGVERRKTKAHVAYRVRDLPAWRKKLAARGMEALEGTPIPGCDRIEFRDPFGNRVEFIERASSL